MEKKQEIIRAVEQCRKAVFAAERYLWQHPETGYSEWESNAYLAEQLEKLGYSLIRADNDPRYGKIPGFYTDIETGLPGPTLCIMGELDALDIAGHPESINGRCHSCGHNAQGAALLGIAIVLKQTPDILKGLCGKIRLMMTPAEEMIQLDWRGSLIRQGTISYMGGKVEFLHRGYFAGVDLALMIHAANGKGTVDFGCAKGNNGCMSKLVTYRGKAAHAGGEPHNGINAQYAATLGLQACNDLRETFTEKDMVRFHPILKGVTGAVNIIPDEMKVESYVRASNVEAMMRENKKLNRALAGAAAAIGCTLHIEDRPGYFPEYHDPAYMQLVQQVCEELVGKERVSFDYSLWGAASSDFGDVTAVMPGIQLLCVGATGTAHGADYQIADPERVMINGIKAELLTAVQLLKDGATAAKKIIAEYKPAFGSITEYLAALQQISMDRDVVSYAENGDVILRLSTE